MKTSGMRTRWAAIGAAVAVTLGAGGIGLVSATSPADAVAYVPIEPCRAADTRPGTDNVGPRATPLGTAETHTVNSNDGQCSGDVPATATGLQLNVTAVDSTIASFITIWAEGPRPLASSLNPTPGEPPVPNAVTTGITAAGDFNIFNNAGSVHVIVDIVGFYTDHHHDDRYYTEAEVDAAVAAAKSVVASENINGSISLDFNAPKSTVSVTMVAPSAGTIVANATTYASDTGAGGTGVRCAINDTIAIDFDRLMYALGEFSGQTRPLAGTRTFDVSAGQSITIHLACDVNSGSGNVQDRSLTAIFVPD